MMRFAKYFTTALICSVLLAATSYAQAPSEPHADRPNRGWSQADAYWGVGTMAEARKQLQAEHGGKNNYFLQVDRFEFRIGEGDPQFLWDSLAWYGGDINKLWVKIEGEIDLESGDFKDAEIQALWSRAASCYFDVQAGVRQDFAPGDDRTFAVIGLQGLAPFWFELDAAIFISDEADVSVRLEAEYEFLLTQQLIFQPRTELNFAFQDVPQSGVGSGLSTAEIGARLRYQFSPAFAPYIGVAWEKAVGDTADLAHFDGADASEVSFLVGIRSWF